MSLLVGMCVCIHILCKMFYFLTSFSIVNTMCFFAFLCFLFLFCVYLCFFSSRRRHTRCALVTGVQTCALPICWRNCSTRPGSPTVVSAADAAGRRHAALRRRCVQSMLTAHSLGRSPAGSMLMFGINARKPDVKAMAMERANLPYLQVYAYDFHARDTELEQGLAALMPEGRKHRICSAGDRSPQMKLGEERKS